MRLRMLVRLAFIAALAACGRPTPVHRGDGGQATQGGSGGDEEPGGAGGNAGGNGGGGAGESGGSGGMDPGGSAGGGGTGSGGNGGTAGDSGGTGGTGGGDGDSGGSGGADRGGSGGGGGAGMPDAGRPADAAPTVACGAAAPWRAGKYDPGALVVDGKPPHQYRCKPFPYDGWCGITAYEPGSGGPWRDAWDDLGACP
jgi:hypothetical protein